MAEDKSRQYRGFYIALALFGAGMLLGFGLCAVTLGTSRYGAGSSLADLGGLFAILFLVSLVGFVITLLGLFIALLIKAGSTK